MESLLGFVVFLFIAVGSSYVINICLRQLFSAALLAVTISAILSATISTILFQIIGYFVMDYLDPFFLIALIVGWFFTFIIGIVIGGVFLAAQKRKDGLVKSEPDPTHTISATVTGPEQESLMFLKSIVEDAVIFAIAQENDWQCVCRTVNPMDRGNCLKCHLNRDYALKHLTHEAITKAQSTAPLDSV